MKKIINKPENYVDEMLEGLYAAHPDYITYTADDLRCLVTSNKVAGKVGIVTGCLLYTSNPNQCISEGM